MNFLKTFWSLAVVFLCAKANATDVWLTETVSVDNASTIASSSQAHPFYAGDYNSFSQILYTNPVTTFHYAPGTYQVIANRNASGNTANNNCIHLGSGVGATIIQQVPGPVVSGGFLFYGSANGFEIHDLTIDCNATNTYLWTNSNNYCAPMELFGSSILISNVCEANFGCNSPGSEYFGCYLWGGNNITIDSCFTLNPVAFAAGGCPFVVQGNGSALSPNLTIKNCCVSNMPWGTQCYFASTITNCIATNCAGNAVYLEPPYSSSALTDFLVVSNYFNALHGVFIAYNPGSRIKSLSVTGNTFHMMCYDANDYAEAFNYTSGSPPSGLDSLSITGNTITESCANAARTIPVSLGLVSRLTFSGNRIDTPYTQDGPIRLDISTVPRRCISSNVDGSQSLVLITNTFSGAVVSQAAASLCSSSMNIVRAGLMRTK